MATVSIAELEMRAAPVDPASDTRWEFEAEVERERALLQDDEEYLARYAHEQSPREAW
jgi:hypothetical protein